MQIELTVTWGDREQDVRLAAPDDAALAVVAPALAAAVGAPSTAGAWLGTDLLSPAAPLGELGLRRGSRIRFGRADPSSATAPVLALHVVGGPAAGTVVPLERGRLTIGRAPDNDLVLADADVSRRHAELTVTATDITIRDVGSANGTFVGREPVPPEGARLRIDDVVRVGASLLTIAGPVGPPASTRPGPDGTVLLDRAPRAPERVDDAVITLPSQSPVTRPRGVPWLVALLPAAAGAAIAWVFGQPEFLLFALLSPLMLISSSLSDRLHWRRSRRRAATELRRQRGQVERRIGRAARAEVAARRRAAPDPADVRRAVSLPDSRVWARRRTDPDLLRVRIGLADLPSSLTVRDETSVAPAGTLEDVPLCVDLQDGVLGLAGPGEVARATARWVVGQLAMHAAPADVELALLVGADCAAHWQWLRWLPHVRGKVADAADDCTSLAERIKSVVDDRIADRRSAGERSDLTRLVVIVDRSTQAGLTDLVDTLARGRQVGVTAIWVAAGAGTLPACCVATARVDVRGSRMTVRDPAGAEYTAVADQVTVEWADEVARSLAPVTDGGAVGVARVPERCGLLDVLDLRRPSAAAVAERWDRADGGAVAAIGAGAEGAVTVDLATDGPHALIAGTTGAGKSELLRTMVAGLAVAHPPDDLNILLIDYKGGAAFAECAQLPHVAGLVTDLEPAATERALRSLRAELRRRERLFAAAGVDDLHEYRRVCDGEPVTRLVIVVDEFATLADELPAFMSRLVQVARLGRSLGVHLVLATQRPASAISAEIRANTELRIALRVADPADSRDVIDSPIAASVERHLAGRGYLRSGSTVTCFQTAHVSGADDRDPGAVIVHHLDRWRRVSDPPAAPRESDLVRLVAAVQAAARERGTAPARSPWRPPLPALLPRTELGLPAGRGVLALGRVDLPDEQRQEDFVVDVAEQGSLLLAGAARSGRTTALVTLALAATAQLSPAELHVHVIDASGDLARLVRPLAHCATVLGPADLGLMPALFTRLEHAAAERLAGASAQPPAIVLLLIDGWHAACAALTDAEAAAATETLIMLLRSAPSVGFAVAVTGDRALLAPRFTTGFAERLLLRQGDSRAASGQAFETPPDMPPGRALRMSDRALLQLAVAAETPEAVRAEIAATSRRWPCVQERPSAIRVRPLPDHVRLADLPAAPRRFALGLAGDDPAPVLADPFAGPARWLVAGPPRSGRTTVLRLLAVQAEAAGLAMLVAATETSPLLAEARSRGAPILRPADTRVPTPPARPTLVLVDDTEAFSDTAAGAQLTAWARDRALPIAVVAAGRADELATTYRGVAAEVRRHRFGVLLRPGPLDGELFGLRIARHAAAGPPGRGVAVADPGWGAAFADGGPVPIQVATP